MCWLSSVVARWLLCVAYVGVVVCWGGLLMRVVAVVCCLLFAICGVLVVVCCVLCVVNCCWLFGVVCL